MFFTDKDIIRAVWKGKKETLAFENWFSTLGTAMPVGLCAFIIITIIIH